jgi:hypothetical protein
VKSLWPTHPYIPMRQGFLYLAAIIDWATRRVLSWRLSNTLTAGFCVEALGEALARFGRPEIFNSDQGSQFTSEEFTRVLLDQGIEISMATPPSPGARVENTGRGLLHQTRAGRGRGGVTRWRWDAVNLWTVGCADTRLTAQARSPMDKPGKTPCVSPTLPTGRQLSTSFSVPQQQQGLNRQPALAYSSRNLSKHWHHRSIGNPTTARRRSRPRLHRRREADELCGGCRRTTGVRVRAAPLRRRDSRNLSSRHDAVRATAPLPIILKRIRPALPKCSARNKATPLAKASMMAMGTATRRRF